MIQFQISEIRTQLIEKINAHYKNHDFSSEFHIEKDELGLVSQYDDLRSIIDTAFDILLIDFGYKYLPNLSSENKLVFIKYSIVPLDYTAIRECTKMNVAKCGGNLDSIDKKLHLYYDETNNIKKFKLKEEDKKFNVSSDTIFVLGGIEANDCVSFEYIRDLLSLQPNVTEVKSNHIYKGNFSECMKSYKLEKILDLLLEKHWRIHFQSLNLLYWSIVDIIDSIEVIRNKTSLVYDLRAMLYRIMKNDRESFLDMVLKYRYPDVDNTKLKEFVKELIIKCQAYTITEYNPCVIELKKILLQCLHSAINQEKLLFIQGEQELILLNNFSPFYRGEIANWKNSHIVFDNESDIYYALKKNPVSIDGNILTNYTFVDSKTNPMIQLSDVIVGIIAKYLAFIDTEGRKLPNVVANTFNEKQLRIFNKLNKVLKISREYNPAFLHQITSVEYHGLLNLYIDKYAKGEKTDV